MSKEKVNNLKKSGSSMEQPDKQADEIKDNSSLSKSEAELESEIAEIEAAIEAKKKAKSEPEKSTEEPTEESTEQSTEETTEEPTEEPTKTEDEIPEELLKKTPEELAKELYHLRKLRGKQNEELHRLREEKKKLDEIKSKVETYQLNATSQHLVNQFLDKMTPEEVNQFYEKFSENPKAALIPIITEVMKPYTLIQAKNNNRLAIEELKRETKDSLIPYEKYEDEINAILSKVDKNGRNELFDRYGSGAFREAYNMVYKKHIEEVVAKIKEEAEKAKREAENAIKKTRAFTEPQGLSSAGKVGKKIDYDKMPLDEAIKKLEEILPESSR